MDDFFKKYNFNNEKIAVGVSGGADSLALVLRLKEMGLDIVALTVDHKLRLESGEEAKYVAEIMQKYGINHYILEWNGNKPKRGIEEKAREARYELISKWCEDNKVKVLAMGHHLQDQAETFLLRLQRGSGIYGLSGILPVSQRGSLTVIRPQLEDTPESLKAYLKSKNIKWVEDPSNQNEDFLRVKIRKFLPILEKELKISPKRLAETAMCLQKTRAYMEKQVEKIISYNIKSWEDRAYSFSVKLIEDIDEELLFYVMAMLIKKVGGNIYIPEADELQRLCINLNSGFRGCTLGKCEIFVFQSKIWVVPELKIKKTPPKEQWNIYIEKNPQYKKLRLPYKLRLCLMLTKPI